MKALIRDEDVILPNEGFEGIDWITGSPLTNSDWKGGPYTLVDQYIPSAKIPVIRLAQSAKVAEDETPHANLECDL